MSTIEASIVTQDSAFSDELLALDIPDVLVLTRLTAAFPSDQTIQHIIQLASDRAIDLFSLWLAMKIANKKPDKTTINGRKIPSDKSKIAQIIKNIEDSVQTKEDEPDSD